MVHTKLNIAIQSLSPQECKSLGKYIIMETTADSAAYRLFRYLYDCKKNKTELLTKEALRIQMFPDIKEKRFLNLCSSTFLILEDWLVWNDYKKDRDWCGVQLLKSYNRRGMFDLGDKTFTRMDKKLQNNTKFNLVNDEKLYYLYNYHYFSENPVKFNRGKEFYAKQMQYWMRFYKTKSLLFLSELTNWGTVNKYDYSNLEDLLRSSIEAIPDTDRSYVTYTLDKLTKFQKEETLNELYNYLINDEIEKGSDLEVFATLYGIAYSIIMWRHKKLKNKDLLLKFHDYGLSSKILMNLGKISDIKFIDIVSIIVITSPPEDVKAFINKWSHLLDAKIAQATVAIAKCYILREEKNFTEIISTIRDVHFPLMRLTFFSLEFLIKAFYKTQEYELALNMVSNFKRRLRKSKKEKNRFVYESRSNFLTVMERLIKRKSNNELINLDQYKKLHHKIWLEKEINNQSAFSKN